LKHLIRLSGCGTFTTSPNKDLAAPFKLPNDTYVLIAAQPDFDQEWFEGLKH
jgi:hypothetical protein